MVKKIFSMLACFIVLSLLFFAPKTIHAQTKDKVWVDVLTCPFGIVVHTLGLAAGDIAKKNHQWLRITSAETPGYIYNLENLERSASLWRTTIIATSPACTYLARKKMDPFKLQVMGIRRLANFLGTSFFLATFDPEIRTVKDLEGKKIGLGYKTQIDWGIVPVMLLKGAGIDDKVKIQHVGTMPATNAMIDGLVDVCGISMVGNSVTKQWRPQQQTVELVGTGRKLYYISWGKELIEAVAKETGLPIIPSTIPKGTLKWQTEDVVGFDDPSIWGAKDVLPEDLAYEYVKLHIEHYGKFSKYHVSAEHYTPEFFANGLTKINAHPGAVQAYEEAGIKIPEK